MLKILDEIYAERQRQIVGHGFDGPHDDQHIDGSLALFAETILNDFPLRDDRKWVVKATDKLEAKHDYRALLVIAASAIVAEIERFDRNVTAVIKASSVPREPISQEMQHLVEASSTACEYRQD